jgi:hygromycin-B 4-O-kinase
VKPYGEGLTNEVIGFRVPAGRFVFRMHHEPGKVHDYLKEQWSMGAARGVGVPTPRVLEVGSLPDGAAYMISEHVEGVPATRSPHRAAAIEQLGRFAARLHTVRTRGYGRVFDWSANRLSQQGSWAAFLVEDHGSARRLGVLGRAGLLDEAQRRELEAVLGEATRWRKRPVLHHGDLRLKNLIVDPESGQAAALLDWEHAVSTPPPYWDLSVALHDLGIDEKETFLRGYGITPRRYAAGVEFMRLLNVLNYAGEAERALRHRDAKRLAWLKLRLGGGLDLVPPPARPKAAVGASSRR